MITTASSWDEVRAEQIPDYPDWLQLEHGINWLDRYYFCRYTRILAVNCYGHPDLERDMTVVIYQPDMDDDPLEVINSIYTVKDRLEWEKEVAYILANFPDVLMEASL